MKQFSKKTFLIIALSSVILIVTVISPSFLRLVLSLPVILFFPGYGIMALFFPKKALDLPARLLLSVGLSLSTIALSGLILHLSSWGISLQNPLVIVLIGGPALLGIYSLGQDILQVEGTISLNCIGFNSRQVLSFMLAAAIAVTAVVVARTPTSPRNLVGYTLFWVQPGDASDKLNLGVQSEEFTSMKYQIRFEINKVLHEGPIFELKPGQTWEHTLQINSDIPARQPITLLLFRLDHPNEVYRRVIWWYENN